MPITPVEVMLGKIIPYVLVGFIQAILIIGIGVLLFGVPVRGSLIMLALLSTLFITTNLSIGYTFSTIAQNQLQAMQMSIMFFLPSILLSGFMFPFLGMPVWAQYIGEGLPLTHYLRIVRAIMLKGATLRNLEYDTIALLCHDDRRVAVPSHSRLTRQARALLYLFRDQVLRLDPVAFADDFGNPLPVTMPVVALVAEKADGTGFFDQRRELVELFSRLRRFQMSGIYLVKDVVFSGSGGLAAILGRAEPS
jgi:ABC-2 type transporter